MKRFLTLTGCCLVIAAQIPSTSALAKDVHPLITIHGLHLRENWPSATDSRNSENLGKDIDPTDIACAKKQVQEIASADLDVDEVEINLEYGNRVKNGSYAQVVRKNQYQIPFSNFQFGERKVLEVGIVMPLKSGEPYPTDCLIVKSSSLKKAIDQPGSKLSGGVMLVLRNGNVIDYNDRTNQFQSLNAWLQCRVDLGSKTKKLSQKEKDCLSQLETAPQSAISTNNREKARAPASNDSSGSDSSSSHGAGSAQ